uniref:Uncharacterized protein n=1 Tax=Arundo donax TaxID=35708 RepID=A0A0A9AME9_ARUDO
MVVALILGRLQLRLPGRVEAGGHEAS